MILKIILLHSEKLFGNKRSHTNKDVGVIFDVYLSRLAQREGVTLDFQDFMEASMILGTVIQTGFLNYLDINRLLAPPVTGLIRALFNF